MKKLALNPYFHILPTFKGPFFWYDIYCYAHWYIQKQYDKEFYRLLDPQGRIWAKGSYESCLHTFYLIREEKQLRWKNTHAILMLHGIAGIKQSFDKMAKVFQNLGYETIQVNYASIRNPIAIHTEYIIKLLKNLEGIDTLSIVTQSMGGLIIREILQKKQLWQQEIMLNKMVMITPPNHGSMLANIAMKIPFSQFIWGESLYDLQPKALTYLPEPDIPFMVITGYTGHRFGYMPIMGEDNDGLVGISSVPLPSMQKNIFIKDSHFTITQHQDTIAATIEYLTT